MKKLQDYIPQKLKEQINSVASENKYFPVYRVDKKGTKEGCGPIKQYNNVFGKRHE